MNLDKSWLFSLETATYRALQMVVSIHGDQIISIPVPGLTTTICLWSHLCFRSAGLP